MPDRSLRGQSDLVEGKKVFRARPTIAWGCNGDWRGENKKRGFCGRELWGCGDGVWNQEREARDANIKRALAA